MKMADNSAPLAGIVICCTSVPDEKRTNIAAQAEQMGAIHRYDLTLDVTHLIIGSHDSEKYRYVARERLDVRPMAISWIEAIRDRWVNDQDLDLEELERCHIMPTLQTLKLSMTGCDDAVERNTIAEQVRANGGLYEGDLTKQITHLISFRTEGPKYIAARNWGIRVVSIEWLRDTLARGMILDERLYDPLLPVTERGKGAWDRSKLGRSSLGKRPRNDSIVTEGSKKSLRRSASTKFNSQGSQIWGEIVSAANFTQPKQDQIFVESKDNISRPQDKGRETAQNFNGGRINQCLDITSPNIAGVFAGRHFTYYGFSHEKALILENHLLAQGATVHKSMEHFVSSIPHDQPQQLVVIIPHDLPMARQQPLPTTGHEIEVVTVWWLERCLHNKAFLEPKAHIIGQPFRAFPVEGFERLCISTSGFSGIDLLHVTNAIKLLGGRYSEEMTARTSVLMAKSIQHIRKDKFDFAQGWNVPIVNIDWLWDCIKAATALSFQEYLSSSTLERKWTSTKDTALDHMQVQPKSGKTILNEQRNSVVDALSNTNAESAKDDKATMHHSKVMDHISPNQPVKLETEIATQLLPKISGPLLEKDINTSSQPASNQPDRPIIGEEYSHAISTLLTKTKSATAQAQPKSPSKGGRRHKRILGRAASNMSATSASRSRATSSDCLDEERATSDRHGDSATSFADDVRSRSVEMLLGGHERIFKETESQPPMTQLKYDDPQSKEAEERAMARMLGRKEIAAPERAKTLTLKDVESLESKPRARRSRR